MKRAVYKLDFVNKGKEFELPDPTQIKWYRKMLKLEADLESKYRDLCRDGDAYKRLISTESNLETMYQILNSIDPKVTRAQVESVDPMDIGKFIFALYRIDDKDFQEAEKTALKKLKK